MIHCWEEEKKKSHCANRSNGLYLGLDLIVCLVSFTDGVRDVKTERLLIGRLWRKVTPLAHDVCKPQLNGGLLSDPKQEVI